MKVIEIVKEHLLDGGYGGLISDGDDCVCELADLAPCSYDCSQCKPGYKHFDPREGANGAWAIWEQKEAPSPEQWADYGD